MILRLHQIGFAVHNVHETWQVFRKLFGLEGWNEEDDPIAGIDRSVVMPFPNDCELCLMESHDPASPISQFITEKGPGLERLVFLTDSIEDDYLRITGAGIPVLQDKIHSDVLGDRLFIPRSHAFGMTLELLQPEDVVAFGSTRSFAGILGINHIGTAVRDIHAALKFYENVLGLKPLGVRSDQHEGEQLDSWLETGNDGLILHPTQSWGENARVRQFIEAKGEGLEHIAIEVADIRAAVRRVTASGVPIHDGKIYTDREDGFEAFIFPEHTTGMTVEMIEPHPTSRYYRHVR
jgi:catechol 2,3-dioxygenase-like lactoylglutathione lyase family enzyme